MDNSMNRDERLIKAVSKKPILYDNEYKYYYDNLMKDAAWEQIGTELGEPADVLRKKWTSLRDCFRKALTKRHSHIGNRKTKQWRYEKQMAFVKPFFSTLPEDLINNLPQETEDDDPEQEDDKDPIKQDTNQRIEQESPSQSPVSWRSLNLADTYNSKKRRKMCDEDTVVVSDYVSSFFNAMEATVRTLSPRLQIEVKSKISTVVSEFELKNLMAVSSTNQQALDSTSVRNVEDIPPKSEVVWLEDEEGD